jgi:hypothetical protein
MHRREIIASRLAGNPTDSSRGLVHHEDPGLTWGQVIADLLDVPAGGGMSFGEL